VDDSPKAFLEELRTSLLRKRVGQIALAVVLAQAAWRLVTALTWYLIIPVIGKTLRGNTESVLLGGATANPFPWENLFGSLLEFGLVVILVFYLNRWIRRREKPDFKSEPPSDLNLSRRRNIHSPVRISTPSIISQTAQSRFDCLTNASTLGHPPFNAQNRRVMRIAGSCDSPR
jgi:large-conductance mechanosensitive channel